MNGASISLFDASKGSLNVTKSGNKYTFNYPCTSSTECTPYLVHLPIGQYKFSLWGAEGGNTRKLNSAVIKSPSNGGKGAFVSGVIKLMKDSSFFFYVGGKGGDLYSTSANAYGRGGFNGGGRGGFDTDEDYGENAAGGGGASDVRIIEGGTVESLKSRIIVAGAGGGSVAAEIQGYISAPNNTQYYYSVVGGDAGALEGFSTNSLTYPGTQKSGCFGYGINGLSINHIVSRDGGSFGGGGGGYYGGNSISLSQVPYFAFDVFGGAGGSSFVSGCKGCNSVDRFPINAVKHTSRPYHFSGYRFTNIIMKSGKDSFLSPSGTQETGHFGNGAIAIEYLAAFNPYTCKVIQPKMNIIPFLLVVSLNK